ncbi:MAG: CPBP family intramembrane metalloprotease [Clostridia bacterium]|nr:CPBP family intramembrane metalloprotease [Clostridia bacterium]
MKNLLKLQKSKMMLEADAGGKGQKLFAEIGIFFAVFLVASTVQSMLSTVPMMLVMFTSSSFRELMEAASSGGEIDIEGFVNSVMAHPAIMLISLLSTAVTIATVILYVVIIEKRKVRTLGLTKRALLSEYFIGLGIGLLMFGAVVLLGVLFGAFSFAGVSKTLMSSLPVIIITFIGFLIQGASEEILCRGYFCVSVARKSAVWAAVLANSLVFAFLHIFNPGISPLAIVNLALFGIFASVYMLKRGNLWGICAIHSIWNFAQGNIFGLRVSGMEQSSTFFVFTQSEGMGILNGGAFGPEGGLCVTIVLVLATAIMLFTKNKDKGFENE